MDDTTELIGRGLPLNCRASRLENLTYNLDNATNDYSYITNGQHAPWVGSGTLACRAG